MVKPKGMNINWSWSKREAKAMSRYQRKKGKPAYVRKRKSPKGATQPHFWSVFLKGKK